MCFIIYGNITCTLAGCVLFKSADWLCSLYRIYIGMAVCLCRLSKLCLHPLSWSSGVKKFLHVCFSMLLKYKIQKLYYSSLLNSKQGLLNAVFINMLALMTNLPILVFLRSRDGGVHFWACPRSVASLQHLCRMALRRVLSTQQVYTLAVPQSMQDFLAYRSF